MNKQKLIEFYISHRGGVNGGFIGLAMAVLILIINPFRTLFIAICVGIGYYIGKRLSEDKDFVKNLLDKILPPGTYR